MSHPPPHDHDIEWDVNEDPPPLSSSSSSSSSPPSLTHQKQQTSQQHDNDNDNANDSENDNDEDDNEDDDDEDSDEDADEYDEEEISRQYRRHAMQSSSSSPSSHSLSASLLLNEREMVNIDGDGEGEGEGEGHGDHRDIHHHNDIGGILPSTISISLPAPPSSSSPSSPSSSSDPPKKKSLLSSSLTLLSLANIVKCQRWSNLADIKRMRATMLSLVPSHLATPYVADKINNSSLSSSSSSSSPSSVFTPSCPLKDFDRNYLILLINHFWDQNGNKFHTSESEDLHQLFASCATHKGNNNNNNSNNENILYNDDNNFSSWSNWVRCTLYQLSLCIHHRTAPPSHLTLLFLSLLRSLGILSRLVFGIKVKEMDQMITMTKFDIKKEKMRDEKRNVLMKRLKDTYLKQKALKIKKVQSNKINVKDRENENDDENNFLMPFLSDLSPSDRLLFHDTSHIQRANVLKHYHHILVDERPDCVCESRKKRAKMVMRGEEEMGEDGDVEERVGVKRRKRQIERVRKEKINFSDQREMKRKEIENENENSQSDKNRNKNLKIASPSPSLSRPSSSPMILSDDDDDDEILLIDALRSSSSSSSSPPSTSSPSHPSPPSLLSSSSSASHLPPSSHGFSLESPQNSPHTSPEKSSKPFLPSHPPSPPPPPPPSFSPLSSASHSQSLSPSSRHEMILISSDDDGEESANLPSLSTKTKKGKGDKSKNVHMDDDQFDAPLISNKVKSNHKYEISSSSSPSRRSSREMKKVKYTNDNEVSENDVDEDEEKDNDDEENDNDERNTKGKRAEKISSTSSAKGGKRKEKEEDCDDDDDDDDWKEEGEEGDMMGNNNNNNNISNRVNSSQEVVENGDEEEEGDSDEYASSSKKRKTVRGKAKEKKKSSSPPSKRGRNKKNDPEEEGDGEFECKNNAADGDEEMLSKKRKSRIHSKSPARSRKPKISKMNNTNDDKDKSDHDDENFNDDDNDNDNDDKDREDEKPKPKRKRISASSTSKSKSKGKGTWKSPGKKKKKEDGDEDEEKEENDGGKMKDDDEDEEDQEGKGEEDNDEEDDVDVGDVDHSPRLRRSSSTLPKTNMLLPVSCWIEVFSPSRGWIHVDIVNRKVGDPLCYEQSGDKFGVIFGVRTTIEKLLDGEGEEKGKVGEDDEEEDYNNNNHLSIVTDVTRRYVSNYGDLVKKRPLDDQMLQSTIRHLNSPFSHLFSPPPASSSFADLKTKYKNFGLESKIRSDEENYFQKITVSRQPTTIPKAISAFKNHPLYRLEQHLKRYETFYPPECFKVIELSGKSLKIFKAEQQHLLHSVERWQRYNRQVREEEKENPIKILKSNAKRKKSPQDEDPLLPLFGEWQTEPLIIPSVVNGKIPRNSRGHVDLWEGKDNPLGINFLPPGSAHVDLPRVATVASKLKIDYAHAMTGFELKGHGFIPKLRGVVVAIENEQMLREAHKEMEILNEEKERKKRKDLMLKTWRDWIRRGFIRWKWTKQLKERGGYEYDEEEGGGGGREKKEKEKDKHKVKKEGGGKNANSGSSPSSSSSSSSSPSLSSSSVIYNDLSHVHNFNTAQLDSEGGWVKSCACGMVEGAGNGEEQF